MGEQAVDLVAIVEALYRFDLPTSAWLGHVADQLSPMIDYDHKGRVAISVVCPDPTIFRPTCVAEREVSESVGSVFRNGLAAIPPEYIVDGFMNRRWCYSTDLRGWEDIPGVRDGATAAVGVTDLLGIGTLEPEGRGCWFGSFQSRRRQLPGHVSLALTRIAHHLNAAYRLRCRLEGEASPQETADAVLDPTGRILHAKGRTRDPAQSDLLARAARSMAQARSRRGRGDSLRAIHDWQAQVGEQWALVDSFERDGRRYVLAIDNRQRGPGFDLLSLREQEVLRQALLGRHNKAIAYELGLADSTVRVLMKRAAAKVGAHSRKELLEKAAWAKGGPEGSPKREQ